MVTRPKKRKTEAHLTRAKFLKKLMIDNETDAASIGRNLGKVRSAVSHFVNGDNDSPEIALAFARIFGLSVDEVLQGRLKPRNKDR